MSMVDLVEIDSCGHSAYLAAGGVIFSITVTLGRVLSVGLEVPIDLRPGQPRQPVREEFINPSLGNRIPLFQGVVLTGILVDEFEVFVNCPISVGWVVGGVLWSFFEYIEIAVHRPSDRGLFRSVLGSGFVGGQALIVFLADQIANLSAHRAHIINGLVTEHIERVLVNP